MQISKPTLTHPPEVYEAILRECGHQPTRVGEHLQACGWTLAAAAWVVVHWDLPTLAAALAHERAQRRPPLTTLSEAGPAQPKGPPAPVELF